MSSITLGAQVFLREMADGYDVTKLRLFLDVLQGQGYFLSNAEETIKLNIKDPDPFVGRASAGMSPRIVEDLEQFSHGIFSEWEIFADAIQSRPQDIAIYFIFTVSEAGPYLHVDSKQFLKDLTHPLWMHLVQEMYNIWHPLYLFPTYNQGEPQNTREQILAHHIQWLHMEYNFFGPELVQVLGRERLLATPGVEVTPLADGGINIGRGDTQQAATYLGLAKSPDY